MIDDSSFAGELAMLGAEVPAHELTNARFLLDADITRSNPSFASVLKLKSTELTQTTTTLVERLAGPAGLEHRASTGEQALHPLAAAVPPCFIYRAHSIYAGSSEVQKDILAKNLMG